MGIFSYMFENIDQIMRLLLEHIQLTAIAVGLAILVGLPLGILISYVKPLNKPVMGATNLIQAVPSMALLGFAIPLLGIGTLPSVIVVFLYSLLPILRNTYVGIRSVDATYLDAAKGMGMSQMQRLLQIELPLAMGVIMAGIRVSTVYVISWTTLAAYIGAGGLGDYIFNGLNLYRMDLVLMGTIPITLLALLSDALLKHSEQKLTMDRG